MVLPRNMGKGAQGVIDAGLKSSLSSLRSSLSHYSSDGERLRRSGRGRGRQLLCCAFVAIEARQHPLHGLETRVPVYPTWLTNSRGHSVHGPALEATSICAAVVCVHLLCAGCRGVSLVCFSNIPCHNRTQNIDCVGLLTKPIFTACVPRMAILSPYLAAVYSSICN